MKTSWIMRGPVAAVVLMAVLSNCSINPATGQRQVSLIGERREIQMGREADPDIIASMGLYPDTEVQQYVSQLGKRLAAASERPDLPWTFRVVDDPTVNAFAVPGGFIYVTRGLMSHLTSEAQLVGVLGHEIGHVTARHSVNDMSKQQLAQIGLGLGMVFAPRLQGLGELASAGLQVLFLKYSRDHENQADELGVRYMRRTNYEPREMADVMTMLDRTSQRSPESGKVPEWLATHPSPPNRVANILQLASTSEPTRVGSPDVRRDEYLQRVDQLIFGDDPREGYFEGTTFLHLDLRFRFEFPVGWTAVNQRTVVQAESPDDDALITIETVEGSPSDELRRFRSRQNVRVGGVSQQTSNGLAAVRAEFSLATEQGVLRGLVAFVAHENVTFRLMGLTIGSRWRGYGSVVTRSLGSFGPLTDSVALSVQPQRIAIVRPPTEMTLSAFVVQYPSSVTREMVALINQVEGDEPFRGGTPYKRVVGGR